MLQSANTLVRFHLHNREGDVGTIDDLYFDDAHWTLRYLVARTGEWFGKEVLLSPHALGPIHPAQRRIEISISRDQLKHAPPVDTAVPISRLHESEYYRYYGFPAYWSGAGMWGFNTFPLPDPLTLEPAPRTTPDDEAASHLQSISEVTGYHVEAADGEVGHIDDFLFEPSTWAIRYLVVDTRNWWPGKRVLVPVSTIEKVDWAARHVRTRLTRNKIEGAPEYGNILPLGAAEAHRLSAYYGV